MKSILLATLILLSLLSCTKSSNQEPGMGNMLSLDDYPYLVDTLLLNQGKYTYIDQPIILDDRLILLMRDGESNCGWIDCYDKETHEMLWHWQDAQDSYGARGFGKTYYWYDDVLCIAESNLSYGIDMSTGETIWHNRDSAGNSFVKGNNTIIASNGYEELNEDGFIRVSDLSTGGWKKVYERLRDDSMYVQVKSPHPINWQGIDYLTFVTVKWQSNPAREIFWLHLYNLTEDRLEWTSDTIPLEYTLSGIPGNQPAFADGQILLANDAIYSYNIEDGSLEWWQWYGNSFVFSAQPLAVDQTVYANNGDNYFIALDVHTGAERFRTTTGGSPSKIFYSDGKCYMSSVSAGGYTHLMEIDAQTGEMLHDETAPFYKVFGDNKQWNFDDVVAVDDQTGRVYTADHKYLLVYEF